MGPPHLIALYLGPHHITCLPVATLECYPCTLSLLQTADAAQALYHTAHTHCPHTAHTLPYSPFYSRCEHVCAASTPLQVFCSDPAVVAVATQTLPLVGALCFADGLNSVLGGG